MRLLTGAGLALALLLLACQSASMEPQCNTRDSVVAQLRDKYGETPVAVGVTHNGGLIEVLTKDRGETWSIIITSPHGFSCLVAAGEGWRTLDRMPKDPPV